MLCKYASIVYYKSTVSIDDGRRTERQNIEDNIDSLSEDMLKDFIKEGETIGTAAVVIQVIN